MNTIWKLKDEEGREANTFESLSIMGRNHFQRLFSEQREPTLAEVIRIAQSFPQDVEEEEAKSLQGEVSAEEVENVIKSMAKDKIPRLDGWPIDFFQQFSEQISSEITDVVEESRRKGLLYAPFNATFIALIPKTHDPESFEDFKPISLCKSVYKIIAKTIEARLKPILSRCISSEHFGFLDSHQIHEAIGVAQETIHSVTLMQKKGAVVKIDLSKAYDRISWTYIRMLLTHLGFKINFINWVMGCITSVSFAVLINGAASPFFKGQRGLREGCPLSPLLFLLVAEGLSQLLLKAKREGSIKATIDAFKIIEKGLSWQIGSGENIRIGRDPWVGYNKNYALSPSLIRHLASKGFWYLNRVEKVGYSSIWGQAWKTGEELDIHPRWWNEWEIFKQELSRSNVRFKDIPNQLIWAYADSGSYSPKFGYKFLMSKKCWEDPYWWAKSIWKLKCPTKEKLFFWCILKRKVPTWDTLQARFKQGLGRCPLCKNDSETMDHLFIGCPIVKKVWSEVAKYT
eukprot:PITA_24520